MGYISAELNHAAGKLNTIRDVLRLSVSLFNKYALSFGHGTDNAYDEAVYLILYTLHLPLDQLEPYLDAVLLDTEIDTLLKVLEQRIYKHLPASYITKHVLFHGYDFYIDTRAIIPRSYLAEIVLDDKLLPWIEHLELVHDVLDLCTGNGSLAIVAAGYFDDASIIASDISGDALEVAQINIDNYNLSATITLCQSDLYSKISNKFDVIVANPPYVDKKRMAHLPQEYRHEPDIALFGGDDGLCFVDQIISKASSYLTDFGVLVMEIGDNCCELEMKYPGLEFGWLNTTNGEGCVFVLTKKDLDAYFGS